MSTLFSAIAAALMLAGLLIAATTPYLIMIASPLAAPLLICGLGLAVIGGVLIVAVE